MKTILITATAVALGIPVVMGQSRTFADDAMGRGYTDRPYLRYEAEDGACSHRGALFINVDEYDQNNIATEASNLQCAQLNAPGDRLQWTLDREADALCIRFSLPDSPEGTGTKQNVAIKAGDRTVATVELNSYWAWQYTGKASSSQKYPDNTPSDRKFARMRFDEANVLLSETLPAGSTLTLERLSDSADPLTIDFVEAELAGAPLPAPEGAVTFNGTGAELQGFINSNKGKTIYIPAGRYEIPATLTINAADTRLAGAGMWHTELYFSANPDNPRTYARRGVKCSSDRCGLSDMSLNTLNNARYYQNDPNKQNGKGLMGSWGKNSEIKNVRIEHFECGAWIADYDGNPSEGLKVTGCRLRNNYADGINLCSGTSKATVSHCSLRNNGDDDMASWSTGNWTHDNLFDHNTAENNWRASSLGFFGGRNNRGTNLAIYDGMEGGARVNADFNGTGFATEGEIVIENVSIRRCGVRSGACGTRGDFWGNAQPALLVSAGYYYDVTNVRLEKIDIYDCRFEGVRIKSSSGKQVRALTMRDICVHSQQDGPAYNFLAGLRGDGTGHNLDAEDSGEPFMTDIPSTFDFALTSGVEDVTADGAGTATVCTAAPGSITLLSPGTATVYTAAGTAAGRLTEGESLQGLAGGVYIVVPEETKPVKIFVP